MAVDVDEAVAFLQFCSRSADQIDTAPSCVAHEIDTVCDCFSDLHQVVVQVLDAVIIVDRPLAVLAFDQFIYRAQAVFDDEQWFLVTIQKVFRMIRKPFGSICHPHADASR